MDYSVEGGREGHVYIGNIINWMLSFPYVTVYLNQCLFPTVRGNPKTSSPKWVVSIAYRRRRETFPPIVGSIQNRAMRLLSDSSNAFRMVG